MAKKKRKKDTGKKKFEHWNEIIGLVLFLNLWDLLVKLKQASQCF